LLNNSAPVNKYASRRRPRPHTWIVKDEVGHQIHKAYRVAKAQANFRKEPWDLEFEHYRQAWEPYWHLRGRSSESYTLTRIDMELGWSKDNIHCINRGEHMKNNRKNQER